LGIPTEVEHYIQNEYVFIGDALDTFKGEKHGDGPTWSGFPAEFVVCPVYRPFEGYVVGVIGKAGEYIDDLGFITTDFFGDPTKSGFTSFDEIENWANSLNGGGNAFFLIAPPGYKIRRFFGRSGAAVDAIGIVAEEDTHVSKTEWLPWYKLGAAGGWEGNPFSDPPVDLYTRVTKISVTIDCHVTHIHLEYTDAPATDHGNYTNNLSCPGTSGWISQTFEQVLDSDEFITGIRGRAGKYLDNITFVTNKRVFGPFGGAGGNPFNLYVPAGYQVRRLWGRSGDVIDAIGVYAETLTPPPSPPISRDHDDEMLSVNRIEER
jgi:hypothetical protein